MIIILFNHLIMELKLLNDCKNKRKNSKRLDMSRSIFCEEKELYYIMIEFYSVNKIITLYINKFFYVKVYLRIKKTAAQNFEED